MLDVVLPFFSPPLSSILLQLVRDGFAELKTKVPGLVDMTESPFFYVVNPQTPKSQLFALCKGMLERRESALSSL